MSSANVNKTLMGTTTEEDHTSNVVSSLEESLFVSSLPAKSFLTKASLAQLFLFELIGMIIFSYGLTCVTTDGIDVQVTISVLLGIIISGYLCGANFNPCVTLMNLIRKESKFTWKIALTLFSAQMIGALIGTSIGILVDGAVEHGFIPESADFSYLIRLFIGEFIGMFFFIFFMLEFSHPNTTFVDTELEGYLIIVFAIYLGRKYAPLSQAVALNFGLSLVIAIVAYIQNKESKQFSYFYIYLIPDILATFAATFFFDRIYEPLVKRQRMESKK